MPPGKIEWPCFVLSGMGKNAMKAHHTWIAQPSGFVRIPQLGVYVRGIPLPSAHRVPTKECFCASW